MNKADKLLEIAKTIEDCSECKADKSGLAVAGEGNANAKIAFVGEAPGKTEAKTGRPFVGRSGKYLRNHIQKIGLDEKNIYITSPVKYLPNSGTPGLKDIEHGKNHLLAQLEVIKPKLVVLLGSTAVKAMLAKNLSISLNHGRLFQEPDFDFKFFVTVHPAAAMRFPKLRKMMDEDFKKLESII